MDIVAAFQSKIAETLAHLKSQFLSIRGGRPTTKLVEDILVEYYGQKLPVRQLGSVTVVPPREIQISVWDAQCAGAVGTAISSVLQLMPQAEGNTVRVHLPPLSTERRAELIKFAKRETEDARIRIRASRDEANKAIQKAFDAKEISEDQKFKLKEQVQNVIDKANAEADALLEAKAKEIEE